MRKGSQLFVEKTIDKGRHIWHFSGMKNPLLEKTVWDWQDAAVAADWAMERGVFGADLWRCFPPEFVRCLAECPEILVALEALVGTASVPTPLVRAGAVARAWAVVCAKAGVWSWSRVWMRFRTKAWVGYAWM